MTMWFIKKTDGTLFGPVDEAKLKTWASQGRVAPDDLLSTDREAWQPAPELPQLDMSWSIHLKSGKTFGPVHALAFCDLMEDGTVYAADKISHTSTGEESTVGEVLLTALLSERGEPTVAPAAHAASANEMRDLRAALKLLQSEVKSLRESPPSEEASTSPANEDVEHRLEEFARQREEDAQQVKEIGDMILKVKDHLADGKDAQQAAARALDALERIRKEKLLLEDRVLNLEAAIEKIVEGQAASSQQVAPTYSGDEIARLREESLTKIRNIETSLQGLFRDKRNQEIDIRQVHDEVDKLKRVYEEEHRISVQREAELAELVEQLQHEKEAVLIALQQARGRRRTHVKLGESSPSGESPSADDTVAGDAPSKTSSPKTTGKRGGIMVTRISRDSVR